MNSPIPLEGVSALYWSLTFKTPRMAFGEGQITHTQVGKEIRLSWLL